MRAPCGGGPKPLADLTALFSPPNLPIPVPLSCRIRDYLPEQLRRGKDARPYLQLRIGSRRLGAGARGEIAMRVSVMGTVVASVLFAGSAWGRVIN